jgi:hypothetical protein
MSGLTMARGSLPLLLRLRSSVLRLATYGIGSSHPTRIRCPAPDGTVAGRGLLGRRLGGCQPHIPGR